MRKLIGWLVKPKVQMFTCGFLLCAFFVDLTEQNYYSAALNLFLSAFILWSQWDE